MKIKTKKQMRLDELIKHVWENDIKNETFESCFGIELRFGENQAVIMSPYVGRYDTFTVPVMEELTEETVISGMTGVYYDRKRKELDLTVMQRTAIKYQLGDDVEDILLAIYVGPTLIWSPEHGIPESGVLEVGAE